MLVTNEKLEAMIRQVQALLRKADDPAATPEESQTFREGAERLMMKYRIDEATLVQKPDSGIAPEWGSIDVCGDQSEYRMYYRSIFQYVVEHVGARGVVHLTTDPETGAYVYRAEFVGYESDLRLVQVLYTDCMLAFQTRLEPKVDPELSEQENAYNMRKAGMEGWRIAMALWPQEDARSRRSYVDKYEKLLYKARRLFKAEAIKRGEDPNELLGQGNNMGTYRESYAHGFVSELYYRLVDMRSARGAESTGLVLAGRKERIDAAFYERYPQYKPAEPLPVGDTEEDEDEAEDGSSSRSYARSTYKDPREDCVKCQKAKSGYCRDHSYLRPSTSYRYRTVHRAGDRAGRAAARSVDLGGNTSSRRLDK